MKRDFFVVLLLLFSISIFGAVYEKVTSAPSDWSGQYLIVYETGKVAFDGSLTTLDVKSNTQTITIIDNKITIDTDIYFTITKSGDKYTIKSASGYFIGQTSDANGLKSSKADIYTNSISFSDGKIGVVSSMKPVLRYNATSGECRFRYYKSSTYTNQQAICLYKLVENQEPECINPIISFASTSITKTNGDANFTNTLDKGDSNGTVIYSSSNTDVADVAETTGEVTIKGVGTTTITATIAKDGTYCEGTAQYTLIVEGRKFNITWMNGGTKYTTTTYTEGGTLVFPENPKPSSGCQLEGWEFAGWSETQITEDATEVILVPNSYKPIGDCMLYAVYKHTTSSTNTYTFTPETTSSASSKPELPYGVSLSFKNTYTNNRVQMTSGNSQTWTITGLDVPLIAVSASMRTNKSDGSGSIGIKVGEDVVYELVSYKNTYGNSAEYTDKNFALTSTDKVGTIVITIKASVNSLYCQSLTITVGDLEILYNSNPDCADIEEHTISFGDVMVKTENGKIANIPELPDACNSEYSTKVGWSAVSAFGIATEKPELIDENTIFTEDTQLYPVYSGEVEKEVSAWVLVTDESTLAEGNNIVIVAKESDYALSTEQKTSNRGQALVSKNGNFITFDNDVQVITLLNGKKTGTFAFFVGTGNLYAASSSSNNLKTKTGVDENASWSISIESDGIATVKAQGENTNNWLRYNDQSGLFSCYASGQKDICIYKKSIVKVTTSEYYICGYKTVESGGVYDVEDDFALNTLTIKSNYDEAGQINVTAGALTAQKVVVEKTIDDSRWYFFSLPFDCELADVVAEDNEGNVLEYASDATSGDYVINEYDQVRSNGTGKAWRELLGTQHTLNAGQGYIIGHFGIGEVIVRFTSAEEQIISVPGNKVLSYTDTWIVDGENSTRGFNLIGLPYYESVGGELQPTLVTIPNDDGITYKQEEYVDADITPFTSFFVQTESAPIFTVEADPVAVPMMCAKGILEKMVLTFSSADGVGCDKTTIINNPNSTIEYEIGRDLVKWIGYADIPQVYSVQGDDILAFNSMAVDNSMAIPLGVYVPADGEYVFAFDEKSVGDVCEWVFVDKELDTETFLGEEDYNIYLEKGKYEDRFELRKQQFVETGCSSEELDFDVWIENGTLFVDVWDDGVEVCVYDAVGRMIGWNRMVDGEMRFDCSERGVYLVVINRKSDLKTVKVVY